MRNMQASDKCRGGDPGVRQIIDENLRRAYANATEQGLPEPLQRLLDGFRAQQEQRE